MQVLPAGAVRAHNDLAFVIDRSGASGSSHVRAHFFPPGVQVKLAWRGIT